MHIHEVRLAMRLSRHSRLVRPINSFGMRPVKVIVLIDLAQLRSTESRVRAELNVVRFDPNLRRRQHLLAVNANAIPQDSIHRAQFSLYLAVRAGNDDRFGRARLTGDCGERSHHRKNGHNRKSSANLHDILLISRPGKAPWQGTTF